MYVVPLEVAMATGGYFQPWFPGRDPLQTHEVE